MEVARSGKVELFLCVSQRVFVGRILDSSGSPKKSICHMREGFSRKTAGTGTSLTVDNDNRTADWNESDIDCGEMNIN